MPSSLPSFRLSLRQTAIVGGGLLLSLAAWLIVWPWDTTCSKACWMIATPFGRDYVNFWMAPRLVLAGEGASLVDLSAYARAIVAEFGLEGDPSLVFVYPPHALLLLAPLALLPFVPAVCLWTALNLTALAATLRFCGNGLLRGLPRSARALLVCLSPASMAMVMYGHFGGLLALASTVAIVESVRRPWLSGLCLACLTVKPQYAAVLGLILLCSGRWRCLPFSAAGTLALVGLSVMVFGIEPWQRFVGVTLPFQSAIVSEFRADWIMTSVTPYFSARFFGMPAAAAWALQAVVAAICLSLSVLALRARAGDPAGARNADVLTLVLLAVVVSQPYASHYDLAAVAPALTLLVLDDEAARARSGFLVAAWLTVPLAMFLYHGGSPVLPLILVPAVLAQGRFLLARSRVSPDAALPIAAGPASC